MAAADSYKTLVEYLYLKVEEGDWHAVSDAANDLRVLEAQHPELKNSPPAPSFHIKIALGDLKP